MNCDRSWIPRVWTSVSSWPSDTTRPRSARKTSPSWRSSPGTTARCQTTSRRKATWFLATATIDPLSGPGAIVQLESDLALPYVRGIALLTKLHTAISTLDDPRFTRVFELARAFDVPVYGSIRQGLAELARRRAFGVLASCSSGLGYFLADALCIFHMIHEGCRNDFHQLSSRPTVRRVGPGPGQPCAAPPDDAKSGFAASRAIPELTHAALCRCQQPQQLQPTWIAKDSNSAAAASSSGPVARARCWSRKIDHWQRYRHLLISLPCTGHLSPLRIRKRSADSVAWTAKTDWSTAPRYSVSPARRTRARVQP